MSFLTVSLTVLIGFLLWGLVRPRYAFRIVVVANEVRRHEGLPKRREKVVLDFLANDVSLAGTVKITGRRRSNGYLKLDFKGKIDPGTKQRIRNFLIAEL